MPTLYKRKSHRGEWSDVQLKKAIDAVNNGEMGTCRASKMYGIPHSTLCRRIANNDATKKALGPSSTFGEMNEAIIATHIKKLAADGFVPSRDDVRKMAYDLAEQLGIKHKFNKAKGRAGYEWLQSFLRRNPGLQVRKSEGSSVTRTEGTTQSPVTAYFSSLEKILQENELFNKPSHIYNMDGIELQLVNDKIFDDTGEDITVITCCNAEGALIPPVSILTGEYEEHNFKEGTVPGSKVYTLQGSSRITTEIFLKWLREQFVPRKPSGRVVLILGGHCTSNCDFQEIFKYAHQNDVILLSLPPDTTQQLQPLDRLFFKYLKSHYKTVCTIHMHDHSLIGITKETFPEMLNEAWLRTAILSNTIPGFRSTGIVPFNPQAIRDNAGLCNDIRHTIQEANPGPSEVHTETMSEQIFIKQEECDLNEDDIKLQPQSPPAHSSNQSGSGRRRTPKKTFDEVSPARNTKKLRGIRKRARNSA